MQVKYASASIVVLDVVVGLQVHIARCGIFCSEMGNNKIGQTITKTGVN